MLTYVVIDVGGFRTENFKSVSAIIPPKTKQPAEVIDDLGDLVYAQSVTLILEIIGNAVWN